MRLRALLFAVGLFAAGFPAQAQITGPASLPNWTINRPYPTIPFTVAQPASYTWGATGLPTGLTLDPGDGILAGTPTEVGNFTVKVTPFINGVAQSPQTYFFTINSAPVITDPTNLPKGNVNNPYSYTFGTSSPVSGGTPPFTWSNPGGGLPNGLQLSSSGVLAGTPNSPGKFNFTVSLTDAAGAADTENFSMVVGTLPVVVTVLQALPASSLTVAYPPVGSPAQPYFSASGGGTLTWSATGLPTGIVIANPSMPVLSGTPTQSGTFSVTVKATDNLGGFDSKTVPLVINPGPSITTTSLADCTASTFCSRPLSAAGGTLPITWQLTSGSVPAGMNLSGNTLSGPPNAVLLSTTSNFTITATDAAGATGSKALSIVVNPAVAITTASPLAAIAAGQSFSQPIAATGGTGTLTWTGSSLPAWLSISSAGMLSGTAPAVTSRTTYQFALQVTDTNGSSASKSFLLTVNAGLTIGPSSLSPWTAGQPYTVQLVPVGGTPPFAFVDAGVPATLPLWLVLNGSTLSGTPPLPGGTAYSFSIKVTDSTGANSTQNYSLQINQPPTVALNPLPAATSGASYTQPLVGNNGTGPLTWAGFGLPSWLTLSGASLTGVAPLVATPTTYNFSVAVTDAAGASNIRALSITVNPVPVILTVTPNRGQPGQNLPSVAVVGQGTNFVNGTTVASFGAGITVNSTTVSDATHATVSITIAAGVATGARTVTLTTGNELATLANGFTVAANTPVIQSVTPHLAFPGQSLASVAVVGLTTNFVNGTTVASFGAGITVNSTTVTDATHATVSITIAANAAAGARTVTLTTGNELATLANGFTVAANTLPVIQSVTPNVAYPGQSLASVAVVGLSTNFINGKTVASFGADVTVNSITVTDATHASLSITVAANAAAGARTLTLATGSEVDSLVAGFTIVASSGTPVILTVTPNTGRPGQTLANLAVVGQSTNFVNGMTTASFGAGITVNSTTVTDATHATVSITIAVSAATGGRLVGLTTGNEVALSPSGFAVTANGATPVIQTVTPDAGQPGQVFASVTVVGQGTNFVDGITVADFGPGITVNSTSVTDATHATVSITIAANAPAGTRVVTMTTGSEIAALVNVFTVIVNTQTPTILTVTPYTGQQEQSLADVEVVGQFTGFVNGESVADFGPGITVNSTTVADPTHARVSITIAAKAAPGERVVTLTTGVEVATSAAGFAVDPALTITNPSILAPWTESRPYSVQLAVTGGTTPYTYSDPTSSLPAWLVLNGSTLSGTPPSPGGTTYSFELQVTDNLGASITKTFTLLINKPPALSSTALPATTSGVPTNDLLSATGGTPPVTWSASGMPSWLALSGASLTGTAPVVAAITTFSFVVTGMDAAGATTQATIQGIVNPPVAIVTPSAGLPPATAGVAYSAGLSATGGTGQVTFSIAAGSDFPPGLGLSPDGQFSGTPAPVNQPTDFHFQVRATDTLNSSDSKSFVLTVSPPPLLINTTTLNSGTAGVAYSVTLVAAGGVPPYTWALASGVLPTGLQLDPTTGVLSGNPSEGGIFALAFSVSDKLGTKTIRSFTLTIVSNLKISSPSQLPQGPAGAAYSFTLQTTGASGVVSWSITLGSLADGTALDAASGTISGIPTRVGTFNARVRAQDKTGAAASLAITVIIGPAIIPPVTINGLGGSLQPAQQLPITLNLSTGFPLDISGQLTVTFTPNPSVGVVDPTVQFGGGTSVTFRIPANSTQAIFDQLSTLQTGSLAGTISVNAVFQAGGAAATSTSPAGTSVTVPLLPPVIVGTPTVTVNSNSIQMSLTGLSTSRKVTSGTFVFSFTAASNQAPITVNVPLDTLVSTWYATPASLSFGSEFVLNQVFNVNGDVRQITGVSITIANDQGSSQAVAVSF